MTDKEIENNVETLKHINAVRTNLFKLMLELDNRGIQHDRSKLESPESTIFARYSGELAETEYGTKAYDDLLEKVKPAIDHHYSKNTHHPQHWENGVDDMDLIDVVEMLCDWLASTTRVKNGNIHKSIAINSKRYNISDQLSKILSNTINKYF